MKQPVTERLYNLLPAIYRQRDLESGESLRAFMSVMEREMRVVEADIERLYDNWFVDTCQEWVLPYIGELLGVRDILDEKSVITSQRRRIANTVRYRRRKGIGAVLENVVYDVTGWRTRVVEFFDRVSITQCVYNVRLDRGMTLDFRDKSAIAQSGGPFDSTAHLMDVRSIGRDKNSSGGKQGKYNISNIGLFLWRLQSYAAIGYPARSCSEKKGCFFFSPTGLDIPLFNKAQTNNDLTSVSEAYNLPALLNRDIFEKDLKEYKKKEINIFERHRSENTAFYGPDRSMHIMVKDKPVPPMQVISADLSEWNGELLERKEITEGNELSPSVAVDVELGRMAFSKAFLQENPLKDGDVIVNFYYGFSADIGGGSYDRTSVLTDSSSAGLELLVGNGAELNTLQKAFDRWDAYCAENSGSTPLKGIIRIVDNGVYEGEFVINLPAGTHLIIEAADGKEPCICPLVSLELAGPEQKDTQASLIMNGLRIDKPVRLRGGVSLKVLHSTIMPSASGVSSSAGILADAEAHDIRIDISHTITGPVYVPADAAVSLEITDSIVDENSTGMAIGQDKDSEGWGPPSVLRRVTVFGQIRVRELTASETIFSGTVTAERCQLGYIRFSYAPPDSLLPIKYRCQPASVGSISVRPHFTSVKYGNPGYAQLSHICPDEIRRGTKGGSEMGAFKHLRQNQREENLKNVIHEYLRQDMEAGVFYVT
ncbi:phage tail protein [Desulfonema magnum]|uniref:Phage tail protein n=1 Tax=Desulfonema magnum TaxID=45655 RepID=A0A975BQ14_9BACT|nr:phage tail protein [Desulfonema magnum]QTA89079.1 Uncharacterized protein dnm_051270 [Desulfonema magnum]